MYKSQSNIQDAQGPPFQSNNQAWSKLWIQKKRSWSYIWINIWIINARECIVQSLKMVEIDPVALKKSSMHFHSVAFISLWKRCGPSFAKKILNPFYWESFVPNLVETDSVVLEKKIFKCGQYIFTMYYQFPLKKLKKTSGQTDDGQQAIRQDHLSCQLRWPKTK